MLEEFMDRVLRDLRATRAKMESDLGKGTAHSYEDYRLGVGKIRGLNEAEELLRLAYSKVNRDKDEDEAVGND